MRATEHARPVKAREPIVTWERGVPRHFKRRKGMRTIKGLLTAAVATGLLALPLLFVAPTARAAGPDTDQSIREGKLVAVTGTTVQIKEWAGTYTYRLSPTGRQALETAQIQPGDEVRFSAYSPWGIAYDFMKMRGDAPRAAASPYNSGKAAGDPWGRGHGHGREHNAVSPDSGQVIGG